MERSEAEAIVHRDLPSCLDGLLGPGEGEHSELYMLLFPLTVASIADQSIPLVDGRLTSRAERAGYFRMLRRYGELYGSVSAPPRFDREKAIATVEAGGCACTGCRGELTDPALSADAWGFCKVCRCAWQVQTIGQARFAASISGPLHTPQRHPTRQLTEADYDGHDDLG